MSALTIDLCEEPEHIIFLLGPPGIGKGTLGKRFAAESGFYHLSVGDHLRELASHCDFLSIKPMEDTTRNVIGLNIDDRIRIKQSQLLDSEVLMPLLKRQMNKIMKKEDGTKNFLIDGFPRSIDQAQAFAKFATPDLILTLSCPRPAVRKRFLERTLRNRPPETAGKFEERYEEYLRNRREIEEWYNAGKVNIVEVDCTGDIESNYEALKGAIEKGMGGLLAKEN